MAKKETNTLVIFYGITPRKLANLLEEAGNESWPHQNESSAAFQLSHLSYSADTETKFLKIHLKDLALRKKLAKKK